MFLLMFANVITGHDDISRSLTTIAMEALIKAVFGYETYPILEENMDKILPDEAGAIDRWRNVAVHFDDLCSDALVDFMRQSASESNHRRDICDRIFIEANECLGCSPPNDLAEILDEDRVSWSRSSKQTRYQTDRASR